MLTSRSHITALAWLGLLIASPLPKVLLGSYGAEHQLAVLAGQGVLILILLTLATARSSLRPLKGLLLLFLAWVVGYSLVTLAETSSWWSTYRAHVPNYSWVLADSLLQAIPTLLMLAVAFSRGRSPTGLFLAKGKLTAPTSLRFARQRSWSIVIPVVCLFTVALTGTFLMLRLRGQSINPAQLLPAIPFILAFPVLNAINEELRFRNIFLAEGIPLFGPTPTLVMTTAFFALAHFGSFLGTGGAGGSLAAGGIYAAGAGLFGYVWGRATLDTKGTLAAWIMHGTSDLMIILGYVLTS